MGASNVARKDIRRSEMIKTEAQVIREIVLAFQIAKLSSKALLEEGKDKN